LANTAAGQPGLRKSGDASFPMIEKAEAMALNKFVALRHSEVFAHHLTDKFAK
jgi:hypothetical protein